VPCTGLATAVKAIISGGSNNAEDDRQKFKGAASLAPREELGASALPRRHKICFVTHTPPLVRAIVSAYIDQFATSAMSSRILSSGGRLLATASRNARSFTTSSIRLDAAATAAPVLPARKPMGAMRGGFVSSHSVDLFRDLCSLALIKHCGRLFGFLLGTTLAGSGVYYYVVQEYKNANDLLQEDIYVRACI
jgi:hypothetical protein